ncbi:GNAT family N-acetyltransferase [Solibacillus sp. FSL H8-0523]|uniref:GNAT family N-acetyltransferase n=1 Tax=Solibacillus sp. FSL H8-0523 TaxID=2954511 RepID=UPI0031013423
MLVRKAIGKEDALKIISVMTNAENSGFMLFAPGERRMEEDSICKFINSINNAPKSGIFIAVEEEEILGYLMIKGENLSRTSHRASIAIGVHSNSRGIGVGTILFEYIINWAKQEQIHRLELTVIENNVQAIHLYKKMGFEIEGIKKDSLQINDSYVNELYMSKLL